MRSVLAVPASLGLVFALAACPPETPQGELPPSGLAGAPGAPSAALTSLPGAGMPVPAPAGGTPSTSLPPGHPPIGDIPTEPVSPPIGGGGAEVMITGPVLETMEVPEYTYMRVKTATDPSGEVWVAVNKTPVAVGDTVTVNSQLVMENFNSKGLNRTFPKLVMGMLVGAPKKP